jgi:hypothetical protein
MILPVSVRYWIPSAGWPVIPGCPGRSRIGRRTRGGCGSRAARRLNWAAKNPTWLPCREGSGQDGSVTPPWPFLERPSNDCLMGFHFAGVDRSLPAAAVQQISVALPF